MKHLFASAFILCFFLARGGDPKFPVSEIPDALKVGANAVIREHKLDFIIHSKNSASVRAHSVITILNEKAKRYAEEVIFYDKLSKVRSFTANLYDGTGKLVRKIKSNEIVDQSVYDGFSLFSDARLKYVDLKQGYYPYTVEFDYEIDYNYLFYIPDFEILPSEKVSLVDASFTIQYPPGLAPRYKKIKVSEEPTKQDLPGNTESLSWSFKNIPAMKFEPLGPYSHELLPQISLSPGIFEYDTYAGSMQTWDDLGKWIASLNRGRNVLPEETKQKIKSITEKLPTTEEKVKAVYEYLQSKTRYVSIQLGIGGYQPFEAAVVDKMGYGDCKALSNYMVSMLETINIKANYVLIYADEEPQRIMTDFPNTQFNHAIVAVPNEKDTIWLECTSQTKPFGFMGRFTGDRQALLITDEGAKVVNTIHYTAEQNVQSRLADVHLDITGDAKAKIVTTYSGIQYENDYLTSVLNGQYDEQKKWIQKNTDIPSFDVTTFNFTNHKAKLPSARVSMELQIRKYGTPNGKRIFLTPNLMNKNSFIPEKIEQRKTPVVRRFTYTDLDTIRFHIPESIYPEFMPEAVKIVSRFGEYEASFKVEAGLLVYTRKLKMNKGEFAPETYNQLVDFYKSISKADNIKMVFLSKT